MLAAQFQKVNAAPVTRGAVPVLLLPSRLVLFALFQLLFAVILWPSKGIFDYQGVAGLWMFAAFGANLVTVLILRAVFRRESLSFTDMYRFNAGTVGRDILVTLAVFVIAAPLSIFPQFLLQSVLSLDSARITSIMFPKLPLVWAILAVFFPLTIAFAELPLYMGYILPRLGAGLKSRVGALLIVGFFLALQHCALPLMFDARFILLRFGMFFPLALLLALAVTWRPRLLPYLMIGHALLDLTTVVMLIAAGSTP